MEFVDLEFFRVGKKKRKPDWLDALKRILKYQKGLPVEDEDGGKKVGVVLFVRVEDLRNRDGEIREEIKEEIEDLSGGENPVGLILLYGESGLPSLDVMYKLNKISDGILGSLSLEHLERGDFEELARAENLVKKFVRMIMRKLEKKDTKPVDWKIKVPSGNPDDMFLLSTYEGFFDIWLDIVNFMKKASNEAKNKPEKRKVLSMLLIGPTGVGKSELAKFISRTIFKKEPLIVNMRAIAESQLEVELFGAVSGAYTGQEGPRTGKIMLAAGLRFKTKKSNGRNYGDPEKSVEEHKDEMTLLLLDEVGDIPPSVQVKLLSYMDTGEVYPLGLNGSVRAPAIIVGTTNRDISKVLRSDFLNRFDFVVRLPGLSEGRNVRLLISYFLQHEEVNPYRSVNSITVEAIEYLARRSYPGGFRELKKLLRRAVHYAELVDDEVLRLEYVIRGESRNV